MSSCYSKGFYGYLVSITAFIVLVFACSITLLVGYVMEENLATDIAKARVEYEMLSKNVSIDDKETVMSIGNELYKIMETRPDPIGIIFSGKRSYHKDVSSIRQLINYISIKDGIYLDYDEKDVEIMRKKVVRKIW